jgi:hypothetical protein
MIGLVQSQLAGEMRAGRMPFKDKSKYADIFAYQVMLSHPTVADSVKAMNPKFRQV